MSLMTAPPSKAPAAQSCSPEDFAAIAKMVRDEAGIVLPASKNMLVFSRLSKLHRECRLPSFSAYVALLRADPAQRKRAVEALTTNHTKFFREIHHFEHLARTVRPAILDKLSRNEPVRVWSAGSSTGQEACSIAMTLLGSDPQRAAEVLRGNLRILATDINDQVLETGRAGIYPADQVNEVPASLRGPWLTVKNDTMTINPKLVALITYNHLNLMADWPVRGTFDAIFCRNTMIYFDEETKKDLLVRFVDRLAPGGFLYIGHSEQMAGPAAEQLESVGQTMYRKVN